MRAWQTAAGNLSFIEGAFLQNLARFVAPRSTILEVNRMSVRSTLALAAGAETPRARVVSLAPSPSNIPHEATDLPDHVQIADEADAWGEDVSLAVIALPTTLARLRSWIERILPSLTRDGAVLVNDDGASLYHNAQIAAELLEPHGFTPHGRVENFVRWCRIPQTEAHPIEPLLATEAPPPAPKWARAPTSVVVPTWRLGGMDVLRAGLAEARTRLNFELVVVDNLAPLRSDTLHRYFAEAGIDCRVVAPRVPHFPQNAVHTDFNTGVLAAGGDVIVFYADYTAPLQGAIERHVWNVTSGLRGHVSVGSRMYYQAAKPELVVGCWPSLDRYVEEVRRLDPNSPLAVSIFASPFGHAPNAIAADPLASSNDAHLVSGFCVPALCNWANDAVSASLLREINGWDERYDGAHTHGDSDTAARAAAAGAKFYFDKGSEAIRFDARPYFPILAQRYPNARNEALYLEVEQRMRGQGADYRATKGLRTP